MIGKNVWNRFGNSCLRFGKIVEAKTCGSWVYARVDWIDDDEVRDGPSTSYRDERL